MTRYTKLQRKTHEKASGFNVTPLLPAKSNDEGGNNSDAPNRNNRKRGFTNDNTGTKSEKALREIEKRKKRKQMSKDKNTICFGCRQKGHSVGNCPKAKQSAQGICYNCGSSEHSLKNCKKPRKGNELPYAKCFVCNEEGHLSGQCSKNDKGLYPNGGGCRFCGQVDHLAKDCKVTKEQAGVTFVGKIDLAQGADDDDYHIFVTEKQKMTDETKGAKDIASSSSSSIKPVANKKKAGKVVKF